MTGLLVCALCGREVRRSSVVGPWVHKIADADADADHEAQVDAP